jgi:hypothetical protein
LRPSALQLHRPHHLLDVRNHRSVERIVNGLELFVADMRAEFEHSIFANEFSMISKMPAAVLSKAHQITRVGFNPTVVEDSVQTIE